MILNYKNTNLDIYIDNEKLNYDINEDVDINFLRSLFNESISILSRENDSLEYWLTKISERNTLVSDLFLDVCRIELIKSLLHSNENISLYTKNIAVYTYFKNYSLIKKGDALKFQLKSCFEKYKPYLQLVKFISKRVSFDVKFKRKLDAKKLSDITIIQTWVSDANFVNGEFKDSYFGDLVDVIKENGKKVITWPIFYNVKSKKNAVDFLRANGNDFLLVEDYLCFMDYFSAIKHFLKKRRLKLDNVVINNSDLSSVFKYYQNKETIELSSFFYSFTKRLQENGSNNITFMQHYENMIPEKALILGVEKYLPSSRVIGYFHTTKPKNILCLDYASKSEYEIAPKPRAIIFNCNEYKEYFSSKYPSMQSSNGLAFKQLHLKNIADVDCRVKCSESVLVLFSGTSNEVELMFQLLNNLKGQYKYLFRMHPMNIFNVKGFYKDNNYEIVNDDDLNELLARSNKILSTYSAVALEAALRGNNIGLVYSKEALLLNPFDDTNIHNYKLISNDSEMEEFLGENCDVKKVEQIFNVDERYFEAFLREL